MLRSRLLGFSLMGSERRWQGAPLLSSKKRRETKRKHVYFASSLISESGGAIKMLSEDRREMLRFI